MSRRAEAALPFWLDRPDDEVLEIALEVQRVGLGTLWIGEMATFDAIALGTAVGDRAPGLRLQLGPLAIGVRSPVAIALGAGSVASLTGDVVHGDIAQFPDVLLRLFHGENTGKLVLALDGE